MSGLSDNSSRFSLNDFLLFTALPLAVGALAASINGSPFSAFQSMAKPPLSPPAWLFPVVWTILYFLMGISSYLIIRSGSATAQALILYGVQLLFNFFWPFWFFGLHCYLFAFFWLIALWILIFFTIRAFTPISKTAALLLVPYLIWVTFAGYLNLGVWILNRG